MTRACGVSVSQRSFQSHPANNPASLITKTPSKRAEPEEGVPLEMAAKGTPEAGRERPEAGREREATTGEVLETEGCPPMISA